MGHFRPVRGLGLAASVLVGLVALGNIAEAAVGWFTCSTVSDYRAGTAMRADLRTVDQVNALIDWPLTLLALVAIVVFIMWLYNARINAERLTHADEHRHTRLWVWLGWFVPVVNLWFPKLVVDDIWRASDPLQQEVPLRQRVQSRTTTRWWTAYILMWLFDLAYVRFFENGRLTTESFQIAAILSTISAAVGVVAAVLAVQVVHRISDFQSTPLSPLRTDPLPG
ncbi:DUF4328 domain-containing protein [Lentzea sp. BCCO 10_0856]|uniref:DUF4328 domain-containing protein n=1 Tax=Lentzea miocenica TaxID=3095431 RepID=A0ABU4ST32_9PSEU|nr:DUF4328 domain-containing protein [Lentzea sp. BCCO 10_0856]MDX8028928.1 DUF4328 domain-containing protein [Lentzea sp. BCCO 10_0856]